MSKRRAEIGEPGPPRHQDEPAIPHRLEFVALISGRPGRRRALNEDLVLADLAEDQKAAVLSAAIPGIGVLWSRLQLDLHTRALRPKPLAIRASRRRQPPLSRPDAGFVLHPRRCHGTAAS